MHTLRQNVSCWDFNTSQQTICDALRGLVPFAQFKKPEKHPWRSVTFITKSNAPPWVFFTFFKFYKWHQIMQNIYGKKRGRKKLIALSKFSIGLTALIPTSLPLSSGKEENTAFKENACLFLVNAFIHSLLRENKRREFTLCQQR